MALLGLELMLYSTGTEGNIVIAVLYRHNVSSVKSVFYRP